MKIYKSSKSFALNLLILLSSSLLFTSCLKDLNDDPQQAAAVNVVNASPGPLTANFYFDNNLVNGPALGFGQESYYILANVGTRKFDAARAGSNESIVSDTLTLETDKYYSVFIAGENASLSTMVTTDDLTAPASGKSKIRFINLSPDGGTLSLGIKDGAALFPGQMYKSATEFISIDPASYMLTLRNADGSVANETSLEVAAGKIYTVWAGGLKAGVDNTTLRLFARAN